MRIAVGLVGLLVTMMVGLYVFYGPGGPASTAVDVGQRTRERVEPWAGQNPDGTMIAETMVLERRLDGQGRLTGITVARLDPQNVLAAQYGLAAGDVIVRVGPLDADMMDEGTARAMIQEAPMRQFALVVERQGQRVELSHSTTSVPAPVPPVAPAPPAPPMGVRDHVQDVLRQIPGQE